LVVRPAGLLPTVCRFCDCSSSIRKLTLTRRPSKYRFRKQRFAYCDEVPNKKIIPFKAGNKRGQVEKRQSNTVKLVRAELLKLLIELGVTA
jgi:hypothetical protein